MSDQNVEIVRRIYELAAESFVRGGVGRIEGNPILELWDPDLVVEEMADFPDQGTYRGYEGLMRWWNGFFEVYDEIAMEPHEFIPVGERVVVSVRHWLHSKAGVGLEYEGQHVWTLRNGRVVHVTGYRERSEALAAVGLTGDDARAG